MIYTTLDQAKSYLGITTTTDDAKLLEFLEWSSRLIDSYKGRRYDVRVETRLFDIPRARATTFGVFDGAITGQEPPLRFDDDLLEIISLTNGDGTAISNTTYLLKPANSYPKSRLRFKRSSDVTWEPDDDGNEEQVIQAAALWGYHDDYGHAWLDSLDAVKDVGGISASATTITVTDADGAMADGRTPRFQVGQQLKADTEYLRVRAVSTTLNTITVTRGENGSTAATHALNTKLYIWQPMGNIVQACTRLTAWRYKQKDVDTFDRSYVLGAGVINVPTNLPADVKMALGAPKVRL